jgi:hypothetical protein
MEPFRPVEELPNLTRIADGFDDGQTVSGSEYPRRPSQQNVVRTRLRVCQDISGTMGLRRRSPSGKIEGSVPPAKAILPHEAS